MCKFLPVSTLNLLDNSCILLYFLLLIIIDKLVLTDTSDSTVNLTNKSHNNQVDTNAENQKDESQNVAGERKVFCEHYLDY